MLKKSITSQEVVEFFNSLIVIDPGAIQTLINTRVQCNEAMTNHPTVQVVIVPRSIIHSVGMLGILNGMFGINENGWGCITVIFDDETGVIKKFVYGENFSNQTKPEDFK